MRPSVRFALAALVAMLTSACVWTSDGPLLPAASAVKPPILPGNYRQGRAGQPFPGAKTYAVTPLEGQTVGVRDGSASYRAFFIPIESYFLVAANSPAAKGWVYTIVRATPTGFDAINLDCTGYDRDFVKAAGGHFRGDPTKDEDCVFTTAAQLRNAASKVVAAVRVRSPSAPPVNSFYRVR